MYFIERWRDRKYFPVGGASLLKTAKEMAAKDAGIRRLSWLKEEDHWTASHGNDTYWIGEKYAPR